MEEDFLYTTPVDTIAGLNVSHYVYSIGPLTTGASSDIAPNVSLDASAYWRSNVSLSFPICNSNSSELWKLTSPICSTRFYSFVSLIIVLIVLGLITLVTIAGNFMVLLALYYYRSLRTMSNCLIGNLAISDLLLSLTVLPISVGNDVLGYWVFGRIMCTIWLCIDVLYCTASIWGLCIIAFDRYTATVYPVWYHDQRSMRKVLAYILFVWIFSIIISLAPFIGWQDMIPKFYYFNSNLNRHECILFSSQSYVIYSAIGSFVLPGCLMVFLYIRIFSVLREQASSLKARNVSCFLPQSPTHGNSPDDEPIQLNMTRENTAITVTSDLLSTSTIYLNGNSHSHSNDLRVPEHGGHRVDFLLDDDVSQDKEDLSKNHLLDLDSPTDDYKQVRNGIRKSCSDALDLQRKRSDNSCDSAVRSKSVNILSDLSSDEMETRSIKKPRKHHRFSLPWNLSSIERNQRMTLSMKRRFELREQRATKRMLLIMASFFICWIPFLLMYTTRSFCGDCYMNDHFVAFIIWLGYANSGVNPILYTVFNEDFRRAFKKILGINVGRLPR